MRRRLSPHAFTLIELTLVVAIIALVSAMAIPRLGNSLALRSVEGAAQRIAADMEFARAVAMRTSTSQTVLFHSGPAGGGYELVGQPDPDHPDQPYAVRLADDCFNAKFSEVNVGADFELVFDMYGVPDSGATLVLYVGDHTRTVRINRTTGRSTVEE